MVIGSVVEFLERVEATTKVDGQCWWVEKA